MIAIKQKIRTQIRQECQATTTRTKLITAVVVLIIGLLLIQHAKGQGIVSEENRWNVGGFSIWGAATETYKIDGDSSFNGEDYKIIWLTFDSIDAQWTYQGLLREDSNKVFYVPPGEAEGLLYDFSIGISDTVWIINMFCTNYTTPGIVTDIDTMEYLGYPRKRWHIQAEGFDFEEFWIEGIGSNMGILHSMFYNCIACPWWDLLCCHQADTLIYQLNDEGCWIDDVGISESHKDLDVVIFPNPAMHKFEVQSAEFGVEDVCIFDLQGRKVFEKYYAGIKQVSIDCSSLHPGIYMCKIQLDNQLITKKLIIK